MTKKSGFFFIVLALTLTACGGEPRRSGTIVFDRDRVPAHDANTDPIAEPIPSTNDPASGSASAPFQVPIKGIGNTVVKMKVTVTRTLRLRFIPKPSTQKAPGQNFVAHYSKLGVSITVNDMTLGTGVLDNGIQSGRAQSSAVLDFSSAIPAGSGPQEIEVTIDSPMTDYYCLSVSWMACPFALPMQPLADLPWNGVMTIETDSTGAV